MPIKELKFDKIIMFSLVSFILISAFPLLLTKTSFPLLILFSRDISSNSLLGAIPATLGQLKKLTSL